MVIRFTSTLTDEDEARIAPALLRAVGDLVAPFQISYSIRIETTSGDIVEDGRAATRADVWPSPGSPLKRDIRDVFEPPR
jgi:hypothetical protein